jgi:hypothetical protein
MVGEVKGSGARNIQPAWRGRVKCEGGGRKESAVNGQQSLGEEEEVEPRMDANEREWGTEELFFKGYRGAEEEEVFHRQGPMCLRFAPAMPSPLRGF